MTFFFVIPAKAGIPLFTAPVASGAPAFAGVTEMGLEIKP